MKLLVRVVEDEFVRPREPGELEMDPDILGFDGGQPQVEEHHRGFVYPTEATSNDYFVFESDNVPEGLGIYANLERNNTIVICDTDQFDGGRTPDELAAGIKRTYIFLRRDFMVSFHEMVHASVEKVRRTFHARILQQTWASNANIHCLRLFSWFSNRGMFNQLSSYINQNNSIAQHLDSSLLSYGRSQIWTSTSVQR